MLISWGCGGPGEAHRRPPPRGGIPPFRDGLVGGGPPPLPQQNDCKIFSQDLCHFWLRLASLAGDINNTLYIASPRPPPTHFDENFRLIDSKTHKIRRFPHLFTEIRPLGPTFLVLAHLWSICMVIDPNTIFRMFSSGLIK